MRKTRAMDWVRFAVTGLGMVINAIVLPGILMLTARTLVWLRCTLKSTIPVLTS